MATLLYGCIPAALVIYLMREREGLKATLWTCGLGFGVGIVLAILGATIVNGTLAIDWAGVLLTAVAMVITGIWVNKDMFIRRPPNDLRNQ